MKRLICLIALLMAWQGSAWAEPWTITYYDACIKCCGKTDGITASGRKAMTGRTVACNWLPFGTKVIVDGKAYVVEDRGAKSLFGSKTNHINHLDVYVGSHKEARKLGKHIADVKVLS